MAVEIPYHPIKLNVPVPVLLHIISIIHRTEIYPDDTLGHLLAKLSLTLAADAKAGKESFVTAVICGFESDKIYFRYHFGRDDFVGFTPLDIIMVGGS